MAEVRTGSLTAVKTGPIGHTMLLPTEQVAAYRALVESVKRQFRPSRYREKLLAQAIVDNEWRLRRIDRIEEALEDLGKREVNAAESQVLAAQRKEFKFLARQRGYLRKLLKADTAELNQLLRENPKSRRGLFLVPPTLNR